MYEFQLGKGPNDTTKGKRYVLPGACEGRSRTKNIAGNVAVARILAAAIRMMQQPRTVWTTTFDVGFYCAH